VQSVQVARKFVSGKLLATREGTIALGVGAAVLAGLIVLAYVNQYRRSVDEGTSAVRVLVARNLIEKGTPGDVVGRKEQFQVTETSKDHLQVGALTDPSLLRGRVAASDIYPGEQLTAADFTYAGPSLGTQLVDRERAVAVPVDNTHGLVGQVQTGDHVDILVGGSGDRGAVIRPLLQDVLVLSAPTPAGGGIGNAGGSSLVLRVQLQDAAQLAFAADNGKIWVVLRPRTGAKNSHPSTVTSDKLLSGRS
jgi:Flp pilus assembly protein CpaB